MVRADFFDEFVLGHVLGVMVDVPALGAEGLDGPLADVLEDEKTEVLIVDGVEDLGLSDGECGDHGFLAAEAVAEGGGSGGGERDGDGGADGLGNGDGGGHGEGFYTGVVVDGEEEDEPKPARRANN